MNVVVGYASVFKRTLGHGTFGRRNR